MCSERRGPSSLARRVGGMERNGFGNTVVAAKNLREVGDIADAFL